MTVPLHRRARMLEPTEDEIRMLEGARLLILEDDIILLMELESLLGDAGAEAVMACATVADALAAAERERFDGAVLDWRLGRETAAPVARRLARLGIPFIFYTGQSGMAEFREWPRSTVLSKPARPREIVAALRALMTPAGARVRTA
jgi:DNA-binding response OmpR family regulator